VCTLRIAASIDTSGLGCEAVSSLLRILDPNAEITNPGWYGKGADLFDDLRLIIELLLATMEFPGHVLEDVFRTYSLLEQAWKLLHDSGDLEIFLATHRTRSKRLIWDRRNSPEFLRRYTLKF
jgi:hypothetical protein